MYNIYLCVCVGGGDHWSSIANITRIVQYFSLATLGKMFICAQLSYISMH